MADANVIARRRLKSRSEVTDANVIARRRQRRRGDPGNPRIMAITAKFIREQAEVLQGYCHSPKRAAAVAEEVERLNRLVAGAAAAIELEDEPSRYAAVIERSRMKRR